MSFKQLNKNFDFKPSLEQERLKFINRIKNTLFSPFKRDPNGDDYLIVFRAIAYKFGRDADVMIAEENQINSDPYSTLYPSLTSFSGFVFFDTLKLLAGLYAVVNKRNKERVNLAIRLALETAEGDLGVEWKDGMFYPAGAKELDIALINDVSDWLQAFPAERKDFVNALEHYSKKQWGDVVSNCYLVVEGLARKILKNHKTLDDNRGEILKALSFSEEWKGILGKYVKFANEYKRHASEKRHELNPAEVEAFLYMTGLICRLLLSKSKADS